MSWAEALVIFAAGTGAGTINTIVGSGTLITFPTLLFFGYSPLTANVSNTVGLVAGGVTGSLGYRRELAGSGGLVRRMAPFSIMGALVGAVLLLVLRPEAFAAIVPVLILLGVLLVIAGPAIQRWTAARHEQGIVASWHSWVLLAGVFVTGIYGGYFGAAQGVILMGVLAALSTERLQLLNGLKNVLSTLVNAVAAATFLLVAREHVDWSVAGLIAVGSLLGGVIGASVGRRLPAPVLRGIIVLIGFVGIVKIVWFP